MPHRRQLHDEYAAVMRDLMSTAVFLQDAVARAAGLNSTDLQALGVLASEGPLSPGELAQRTGLTSGGAVTLLVDRLEAAGFAHRSRDDHDRRRVRITADQEQVDARLSPLYDSVGREWDAFLETLGPDELRTGIAQLRAAVEINRDQIRRMADRPRVPGPPADGEPVP